MTREIMEWTQKLAGGETTKNAEIGGLAGNEDNEMAVFKGKHGGLGGIYST